MKTKSIIIAAAALLALSTEVSAQKKIKETFAEIEKHAGVSKVSEQNTSRCIDTLGITCQSSVVTIMVKKDYYGTVIDKLSKAFESESKNATMTESETAGERPDFAPIVAPMPGQRRQWSVWREGAEPVIVGGMGNSCFIIANYDDSKHPDYRTCCAAEWSRTDNPDVYKAQLTYVYGRRPDNTLPVQYHGSVTWPTQMSSLTKSLEKLRNLPDSLFTQSLDPARLKIYGLNTSPKDIPFEGNMDEWMNAAMNQVKHLSASDWHRFFGLLTEKMVERAATESSEDLVVSAGIILDLCKNADQLDADEREVSARRLTDIAQHHFDNDRHQYVCDLLMLGAKKLTKE